MVECKGEMQITPSWMWGKPDEEDGAEREMCVLDDLLDVLSEDSPAFARLSEHHHTWLPHPLDFNGEEVTEVREREPIPFVLVLRDANILGTGYVYDNRFLYRCGYWYFTPRPIICFALSCFLGEGGEKMRLIVTNKQVLSDTPQSAQRNSSEGGNLFCFSLTLALIKPLPLKVMNFLMEYNSIWQHFIFDSIPKIDFVFDFIRQNPQIVLLVTRTAPERYMKLLFPNSVIMIHEEGTRYTADVVYLPQFYKYVVVTYAQHPHTTTLTTQHIQKYQGRTANGLCRFPANLSGVEGGLVGPQ